MCLRTSKVGHPNDKVVLIQMKIYSNDSQPLLRGQQVLCISTSIQVLRAPESWLKHNKQAPEKIWLLRLGDLGPVKVTRGFPRGLTKTGVYNVSIPIPKSIVCKQII